jgi:uncharacterized repeat protein (TIGR01451 family)
MKTQTHSLFIVLAMLAVARIGSALGVADLSLSANGPGLSQAGVNLSYSITVSNAGPDAATGVVVSNRLPANVTFVSATGGSMPTNGVLLLNLGTLAAGSATNSIQIVVQPTLGFPAQSLPQDGVSQPTGQLTNMFQVFANQTNSNPANNYASVITTVFEAVPGTPIAGWGNPGGHQVITESILLVGAASPIQVRAGIPATNGQPGDIVLVTETNDFANPTNWAAVARFFNPGDPTGTNGLPATYSQVLFSTNFSINSFRLFPDVAFIPEGTVTTNNGVTSIVTDYVQIGPADAILVGQENIGVLTIAPLLLTIAQTNNEAIVTWSPLVTGWTLQTNNNLATGAWGSLITNTGIYTDYIATNSLLTGNLFFRLYHP